jgi:oligopeptidase B
MLGYGAYGQPLEADFRAPHLPLLNRGWVIALAHVRYTCSRGARFWSAWRLALMGVGV